MTDEILNAQTDQSLIVRLADQELQSAYKLANSRERSPEKVAKRIYDLVMLDHISAQECVFALPRGGKPVRGPSIRFAETICSQYGNCRVGARVVHVDRFEKFLEAEGVFHDLETNSITTERVRRRIADSRGRLFNDDMITITGNAACSIAKRNAILKAIPRSLWRKAFEAAEGVLAGDAKSITERRLDALKRFSELGVKPQQIFEALEVEGEHEIGLDQIGTLAAIFQSIKAGDETVESYFPKATDKKSMGGNAQSTLEKIALGGSSGKDTE